MTPSVPSYNVRPIGSIAALARALGVGEAHLLRVARRADQLYRGPIVVRKRGKKPRDTFAPSASLLDLQNRILDRILKRARYPAYLMGGLPGRNYIQNAQQHAGAKIVFGQDVESFFPSVTRQRIESIFKHIFHFPPDVAALLAKLCSRHGSLVQGAPTSNHLGNLALYREEPAVEQHARINGFVYTRFVDDIHLSSCQKRSREFLTATVWAMRSALERLGHKPKRAKQFIATPRQAMRVHGLNVNSAASLPARRRQSLRNEVFLLERWSATEPWAGEYRSVNITKGEFMFAAAAQVPRLMQQFERGPLCQYTPCRVTSAEEQAEAIAIVHAEFVLVHPFREGNGRCARLLAMLMGLQAGLPALDFGGIRGAKKRGYIAAVHSAMDHNYAPMTEVFREVIARTLRSVARTSSE